MVSLPLQDITTPHRTALHRLNCMHCIALCATHWYKDGRTHCTDIHRHALHNHSGQAIQLNSTQLNSTQLNSTHTPRTNLFDFSHGRITRNAENFVVVLGGCLPKRNRNIQRSNNQGHIRNRRSLHTLLTQTHKYAYIHTHTHTHTHLSLIHI